MARGKKTGGRVVGTPNKLTRELRTVLKNVVHSELENFQENLGKLSPKERMEFLIKILPYVLPKVEAVNYQANEPFIWEIDSDGHLG